MLRRHGTLRALLSYAKPLCLVLAGDVACRLRLPTTHHRVLLANDGALAQARARERATDARGAPPPRARAILPL